MNIKVTDYCTASNSSMGVNEAIKNMQSGDTLLFPTGEYHFYKDFSIHKVCYMTNTDSFKAPDKYFAIDIENKDGITVDGCGSTFVIHGDMCSLLCLIAVILSLRILLLNIIHLRIMR
ncbi:MAG: hypothetical protein ACLS26_07160 [Eubacterium sp.]